MGKYLLFFVSKQLIQHHNANWFGKYSRETDNIMVYQVKDPHIIAIPYSILNPCKSFILHFHISHIDLM